MSLIIQLHENRGPENLVCARVTNKSLELYPFMCKKTRGRGSDIRRVLYKDMRLSTVLGIKTGFIPEPGNLTPS